MVKEVLHVFRSVFSELQMRPEEWPDLLPLVQNVLNTAPSAQGKHIAPVTIFIGIEL